MTVRNTNLEFFLARAAQARSEAEAATLDHVRERCRRSEAAWTALADRAERSEQLKAAEALRKAGEPAQVRYEKTIQEGGRPSPQAARER